MNYTNKNKNTGNKVIIINSQHYLVLTIPGSVLNAL